MSSKAALPGPRPCQLDGERVTRIVRMPAVQSAQSPVTDAVQERIGLLPSPVDACPCDLCPRAGVVHNQKGWRRPVPWSPLAYLKEEGGKTSVDNSGA